MGIFISPNEKCRMMQITNLQYEKIDPLTTLEKNPMVEYAKGVPDVFLYKIQFVYYGCNGSMFTLVSRKMVEDSFLDLEEILMGQALNYAEDNLPMNLLVDFLKLLNDKISPAKEIDNLSLPHNINYVNDEIIEVNLYPLGGGSYHLPVKVIGKSSQEVVQEIFNMYRRLLTVV